METEEHKSGSCPRATDGSSPRPGTLPDFDWGEQRILEMNSSLLATRSTFSAILSPLYRDMPFENSPMA